MKQTLKESEEANTTFFDWYYETYSLGGLTYKSLFDNAGIFADDYKYNYFPTHEEAQEAHNKFVAERIMLYEIAKANKANNNWKPGWDFSDNKYRPKYIFNNDEDFVEEGSCIHILPIGFYFGKESFSELQELLTNYPFEDKKLNIIKIWFTGKE